MRSKLFKYTIFGYIWLFIFKTGERYLRDLEGSRCGPLLAPYQHSTEENSRELPQNMFSMESD